MNELTNLSAQPEAKPFDYSLVDQEQEMKLREISARLTVRVQRTAEEMLAMGADLREAKIVVKEDGRLFTEWCESDECPVGIYTAQRLMSVHERLGNENRMHAVSDMAFGVISAVTQTRDEDIRQALLAHIEKEAESGEKVSQKEITALKKALSEEKARADALEDKAFDASNALTRIKAERDEIHAKKERFVKDLMAADKERKELQKTIMNERKAKQQAINDAREVFEQQLEEMRVKIAKEERDRPRTSEEVEKQREIIENLRAQELDLNQRISEALAEQRELKRIIDDESKAVKLRDRVLSDFQKAAMRFQEDSLAIAGAAEALKQISMTDAVYEQIKILQHAAKEAMDALSEATCVQEL